MKCEVSNSLPALEIGGRPRPAPVLALQMYRYLRQLCGKYMWTILWYYSTCRHNFTSRYDGPRLRHMDGLIVYGNEACCGRPVAY